MTAANLGPAGDDTSDVTSAASKGEQAYQSIKGRILELHMAPGAPFKEGELATRLGLGKTPVREALARLRREGLVEVAPRSGYRVSPVTLRRARELFGLRTVL